MNTPLTWKAALHRTCVRSPQVPAKVVAASLGISYSTLLKACDEGQPDHLSSRHLAGLVQIPRVDLACLDYLEALAGRVAIPRLVDVEVASALGRHMAAIADQLVKQGGAR